MELKTYFRILVREWWIVILVFLITVVFTLLFSLSRTRTYSATATFIVSPSSTSLDARGVLSGLDILGSKTQVANTYAEIATSDTVRQEAGQALGLPPDQAQQLAVNSKLRAGTNVIEISVEGPDPLLIANFANKVGESAITHAEHLYEVYDLKALDPAKPTAVPIKPNIPLNLVMGAGLGLALGAGLAFLFYYLQTPTVSMSSIGILDSESGAFSNHYFARRLKEEMSRARRHQYPLTIALMNIDPAGTMQELLPAGFQGQALRMVTAFFRQHLREEDVLSRIEGTVFGFLLPDTLGPEAKTILEKLEAEMAGTSFKIEGCDVNLSLRVTAGLASYQGNGTGRDELLADAYHALKQAQADGREEVFLFSKNGEGKNTTYSITGSDSK